MGMELMVDWDDLEDQLKTIPDPNKKTFWNEELWKAIGMLVLIFALTFLPSVIYYTGGGSGFLDTGWNFNYNIYLQLLLSSLMPILVVGLKVEASQKKYFQKLKITKMFNEAIKTKDNQIAVLKKELNDKCTTIEANTLALAKAKTG